MTTRRDAWATIFSRSSAPPMPFTRSSSGETSSAPSMVRSGKPPLPSSTRSIPSSRARASVWSEVGTPTMSERAPLRRAAPRSSRRCRTVLPVPRPRTIPLSTKDSAARAEARLRSSGSALTREP